MKTLYVRINPRQELKHFWRCGMKFGQDWQKVSDLDAATAQRLEEEQMLEVTETRPAVLDDEAQAGDSAAAIDPVAGKAVPPADASIAEVVTETPLIEAMADVPEAPAPETVADQATVAEALAATPKASKKVDK